MVYQRKDGRWVGSTYVLTPAGERVRRSVYGTTRKDAADKLSRLLADTAAGRATEVSTWTVGAYLDHWLVEVAAQRVRPTTLVGYRNVVRHHITPAIGGKRLVRLTAVDVRGLLTRVRASGRSARTVQLVHAVLRTALAQAVRDDLLTRNVATLVTPPPVRRDRVDPWSPEEARAFLAAARQDRLYALYAVALAIGLRRGEVLGLLWEDVDLDGGVLRVRRSLLRVDGQLRLSEPKSRTSTRTVPLPAVCVAALRARRRHQAEERLRAGERWTDLGLIFATRLGTPIEPRNLNRALEALIARAGVRRIRLHDLRHTCATLLLAQGVPARVIMETLGHSQIAVTMNTYAHVLPAMQRDAADQMDAALGDPGKEA